MWRGGALRQSRGGRPFGGVVTGQARVKLLPWIRAARSQRYTGARVVARRSIRLLRGRDLRGSRKLVMGGGARCVETVRAIPTRLSTRTTLSRARWADQTRHITSSLSATYATPL